MAKLGINYKHLFVQYGRGWANNDHTTGGGRLGRKLRASDRASGRVEEGGAGGGIREGAEEEIGEEAAEDPGAPDKDKPRPPPVHTLPGCPCSALPPRSFPGGLPPSPASSLHSWL